MQNNISDTHKCHYLQMHISLFTSGIFIFSLSMHCNWEASSGTGRNKLRTQVSAVKEVGKKRKKARPKYRHSGKETGNISSGYLPPSLSSHSIQKLQPKSSLKPCQPTSSSWEGQRQAGSRGDRGKFGDQ